MSHALRNTFTAAVLATALAAALAPVALAGGANVRVEGPARDGRTYTVRTFACSNPASLEVQGFAEGVVGGKRQSLPLVITATGKQGVYHFKRTWSADGRWMVRLTMGGGRLPATVASFDQYGKVQKSELIWKGDGLAECRVALGAQ